MKTLTQTNKKIANAWLEIAEVLDNTSWHAYGAKYLAENVAEEKEHRGFCSGRNDYALTVAQSARLFAVRQIAELLISPKNAPKMVNYLSSRKSCFTAYALVLNYGPSLRKALKGFDPAELAALDYAELVKPTSARQLAAV